MRKWLIRAGMLAAVGLPWAVSLGPLASGERILAYRDTVHFYYPWYAWIADCWGRGELPLWNPQQGTGAPVVAEATSAVFYPGKLILALPGPYRWRFNLYVLVHVGLAAGGAYAAARCWRASRPAAALGSLAYAAGGSILFQTCNVVFLVGAGWLPWALLACDRVLRRRHLGWALGLGAILACMVLGGDPQMAYHTGLIAGLYAIILWRSGWAGTPSAAESPQPARWSRHPLGLLLVAAITGALLAAVQIVPALRWTNASRRAMYEHPRAVWEVPEYWLRAGETDRAGPRTSRWAGTLAGLFGPPVAGTHHGDVYQFSIAPWRCAELIWPNVSGRTIPRNERWLAALGGEDRIWAPSLYLGLVPLLLALSVWTVRGPDARVRWLSWLVLLSLLGSFGWYAPGWIAQQWGVSGTGGADGPSVGAPTGGLYWLLVVCLPGYVGFRYPAKLFTCAALGLALLAAIGCDALRHGRPSRFRVLLTAAFVSSLVLAGMSVACRPWWNGWFSSTGADELFGPVDAERAWFGILVASGHAALVAGLSWWLTRLPGTPAGPRSLTRPVPRRPSPGGGRPRYGGIASWLLILTALELTLANRWLVVTAPFEALSSKSVLVDTENATERESGGLRFYRLADRRWAPSRWRNTSSSRRPAETVRWDRWTLFPNYHLLESAASIQPQRTLAPSDFTALLRCRSAATPHPHVLNLLGVTRLLLPAERTWPDAVRVARARGERPANAQLWQSQQSYPRAWIVHDVRVSAQRFGVSRDPRTVARQLEELLFSAGQPRDLRQVAVVAPRQQEAIALPPSQPAATEHCRVVAAGASFLVVEARLKEPGFVVVSDYYAPGWTAVVEAADGRARPVPILRTNGVMRGVPLPAGAHRLVFRYRPRDLYLAAAVSLTAWTGLLLWIGGRAGRAWLRRQPR